MKIKATTIVILLIIIFNSLTYAKYLSFDDRKHVADLVATFELINIKQSNISKELGSFKRPYGMFERIASDSILRVSTLADYESLSKNSIMKITIDTILLGLSNEFYKNMFNVFLIPYGEASYNENYKLDTSKLIIAIDSYGNNYCISGCYRYGQDLDTFSFNEFQRLYQNCCTHTEIDSNKLYIAKLYLHYILGIDLGYVGTIENIKRLKYYYKDVRAPEYINTDKDTTLTIYTAEESVNSYKTKKYYFRFTNDSLLVQDTLVYTKRMKLYNQMSRFERDIEKSDKQLRKKQSKKK